MIHNPDEYDDFDEDGMDEQDFLDFLASLDSITDMPANVGLIKELDYCAVNLTTGEVYIEGFKLEPFHPN